MLTTEQSERVATELWGYEWLNNPNGIMGVWLDDNRRTLSIPFVFYKKEVIKKEVNSWQGFGRTVEAMAKRKWAFSDSSSTGVCFYSHLGDESPIKIDDNYNNPRQLITATHLSALEAINDNQ